MLYKNILYLRFERDPYDVQLKYENSGVFRHKIELRIILQRMSSSVNLPFVRKLK